METHDHIFLHLEYGLPDSEFSVVYRHHQFGVDLWSAVHMNFKSFYNIVALFLVDTNRESVYLYTKNFHKIK